MATISLKLNPPNSGFYQLENYVIGPVDHVEIDATKLATLEKANIMHCLRENIMHSLQPYNEARQILSMGASNINEVLRGAVDAEMTEKCKLGDMVLGVPVVTHPMEGAVIYSDIASLACAPMEAPGVYTGDHEFSSWVVCTDYHGLDRIAASVMDVNNLTHAVLGGMPQQQDMYLTVQHGSGRYLSGKSIPRKFQMAGPSIRPPHIVTFSDNDTGVSRTGSIQGSSYDAYKQIEPLHSSQWVISESSDFTQIVVSETIYTTGAQETLVLQGMLAGVTEHFIKLRYMSSGYESPWSSPISFTTGNY